MSIFPDQLNDPNLTPKLAAIIGTQNRPTFPTFLRIEKTFFRPKNIFFLNDEKLFFHERLRKNFS